MPGTKVADAYVSIIPETKGFGNKLQSALGGGGGGGVAAAGGKIGGKLAMAIMGAIAAAGIGTAIVNTIKQSIQNGAQWEQLSGGAKLMFGEAYDFIEERAKQAYANVQMSQNDYMQQVNGLATGLKTALGGNAQAAAELADRVITAEADVVSATGASQEAVQNAFNGKEPITYTMRSYGYAVCA